MIIAEDQGQTRPSLNELEDELNIPGMDILQYRMETKLLKKPSKERSVVYTSTPDTPTMEEDYLSYDNNKRIALRRFFKKRNYSHRTFHDLVCHYAIDSDARLVLVNLADLVGAKQPISLSTISPEGELVDWSWKLKDFKVFPSELKKQRVVDGFGKAFFTSESVVRNREACRIKKRQRIFEGFQIEVIL